MKPFTTFLFIIAMFVGLLGLFLHGQTVSLSEIDRFSQMLTG